MKTSLLLAAVAIASLTAASGAPALAQSQGVANAAPAQNPTTGPYAAAIADPLRPASEVERDPLRHPAEMLAFAQLKEGDRIADIRPEEGYFTRLFARAVGGAGRVYAFVPNQTAARENVHAEALVAAYPNVNRITGDLDAMTFPEPLDVVFMGQEYHDFVIPRFGVDVAKMNAAAFAALKPGGLYVILDHQAAPGTGISAVGTLHRIEGSALRAQVEAAGFVFDGETSVVANPDDDHSLNVFDPAIRGKTDQFVYRFKKPAL